MQIAVLGATSQIAKDLIKPWLETGSHDLFLYARRPEAVTTWLLQAKVGKREPTVASFEHFGAGHNFDAILNFVGSGDPARTQAMGVSIFEATSTYDELALRYCQDHPGCKYIFLSSGATYGANFDQPVTDASPALIPVNHLQPQDWYGIAKLYAEARHRALQQLPIFDIRVFNYFSRTQDLSARFLITDILNSISKGIVLKTSPAWIARDFVHPSDCRALVEALLYASPSNIALDCYSRAPIDKPTLLAAMEQHFGLRYEVVGDAGVNATGNKPHYYSTSRRAADFGYKPKLTSLEGILQEAHEILNRLQ